MIDIKTHPELYNDRDVTACLDFCKKLQPVKLKEEVIFHKLWRNKGNEFGRKQILAIKSFIVTQQLDNCKLVLWTDYDIKGIEQLLPFIEIRHYSPIEEAKNTVLENDKILHYSDKMAYVDGDLFRLLILHKYGGLYSDMDVVFLRDLSPVLSYEFMYGWGSMYNTDGWINGAVMKMFKNSQLSNDFMNAMKSINIDSETALGKDLYLKIRNINKNWVVFPAGFFNTEWQFNGNYLRNERKDEEFTRFIISAMKKTKYSNELFDGAFSWHWHNKWKDDIEEGSKFQIIESIINDKFNKNYC